MCLVVANALHVCKDTRPPLVVASVRRVTVVGEEGDEQAPASSLISWPKTSCFALGFLSQKRHVSTAGQSKIVVASGSGEAPKMRNRVGSVEKCKQVGR